ncbi:MAG: NAD(P)-dependent oxidoreductase [candidate division WOR-3 bacterium]
MLLVTGATGFIGKNFVLDRAKVSPIKILVRRTSNIIVYKDHPNVLINYADLENDQGLDQALEDVDIVVHCAARTMGRSYYEFYHANVVATQNLINAMRRKKVNKILFLSSQSAGGPGSSKNGVDEKTNSAPVSFYGITKRLAEEIVINSGLDYIILRPCSVYGPYDMEILKIIRILEKGFCPNISKEEKYINLIFEKDLIALMEIIIAKSLFNHKTYYVSDGICYAFNEVIKTIQEILQKKECIKINIPEHVALLFGILSDLLIPQKIRLVGYDKIKEMSQSFWVCVSSSIMEDAGWSPHYDLKKGMEETIRWYRENNYLSLD